MRPRLRCRGPLIGAVLLFVFLPGCTAFVQYGSETDFGLGVRGSLPMDRVLGRDEGPGAGALSRLELAGSLSRSWPTAASWTEGSLDALVPLFRLADGGARTYAGAGVHLGRIHPDVADADTETKFGGNLVGGIRFEQRIAPLFEVRASLGGIDQLSALAGVQFFGGN